jgi:hypothetical protein
MSRRSNIALLVLAGCGSAEPHETTTPPPEVTCPSETSPERCSELGAAAETAGKRELAWAYTVLECESPRGTQCVAMWQRHAKLAPTQTDALNVLHAACGHLPAACEQLAAWHRERGHVLAAAAYQKHAATGAGNAVALADDLAAVMHVSDAPPRTDAIAQMVAHELPAPVVHPAAVRASPKPWAMHAAELGASADGGCATTAMLDKHPVGLEKCVIEIKPLHGDEIALLNRCGDPINVAYAGARAGNTFMNRIRLRPYEAHGAGGSHADIGRLTYAVCRDGCRATNMPDDVSASWTAQDTRYYCMIGP